MKRAIGTTLVVLVLAGCARFGATGAATSGGSPSGAEPPPSGARPPQLAGTWQLVSGSGPQELRLPADGSVTIAFEGDRVSGRACNLYGGTYRLGEDGSLTLSAMGMTEMACEEPMMSLEAAFHAALALVRSAAVDGERLTLRGDGAELVFTRLADPTDAPLVGTHWTLTTLLQGDVASSALGKGWLQLQPDGTLSGSTGCRGFDARYTISGDRLRVTDVVEADNACEPPARTQDRAVLELLRGGISYGIRGQQLTLTGTGIVAETGLGYTAARD